MVSFHFPVGKNALEFTVLRPGDNLNITLLLINYGTAAIFELTISAHITGNDTTDIPLEYTITPKSVFLNTNETAEVTVMVTAAKNVTDGQGASITVTTTSVGSVEPTSDFVNLAVIVSTSPPPEDTENVRSRSLSSFLSMSH